MNDLTVGLLQSDLFWEDEKSNHIKFGEIISKKNKATLLVLPEMFSTGFSMSVKKLSQTMHGETVNWMKKMSSKYEVDLIGSAIIEESSNYYNRLLWVDSTGGINKYDKRHLFSFASEDKYYTAGTDKLVVNYKGWNIATFICYDLRFPVWSRNTEYMYDLAIYIANWPETRKEHWKSLLVARAIENQSYVMGVNRVGTDGNGLSYSGDSMLVDPLGNIIFLGSKVELYQEITLDKSTLLEIRKSFRFLPDADSFSLK